MDKDHPELTEEMLRKAFELLDEADRARLVPKWPSTWRDVIRAFPPRRRMQKVLK